MNNCDHFIRCQHPDSIYITNDRGRQSITVPIICDNDNLVTIPYQFMCFSSCTGTINRRPIQLIFTLENR